MSKSNKGKINELFETTAFKLKEFLETDKQYTSNRGGIAKIFEILMSLFYKKRPHTLRLASEIDIGFVQFCLKNYLDRNSLSRFGEEAFPRTYPARFRDYGDLYPVLQLLLIMRSVAYTVSRDEVRRSKKTLKMNKSPYYNRSPNNQSRNRTSFDRTPPRLTLKQTSFQNENNVQSGNMFNTVRIELPPGINSDLDTLDRMVNGPANNVRSNRSKRNSY